MTIPLTGMIAVTGERDSGKTTFCLTCGAQPKKILFLDDDIKGRATINEIVKAGYDIDYHDLVALSEDREKKSYRREREFYTACMNIIEEAEVGQYDVLIWDTFTRFEACIHANVVASPHSFREFYSAKGDIKGGQMWQEANRVEATVLAHLMEKFPLVFLTCHLKDGRAGSVKTGKQIPARRTPVDRKARMSVWLRGNPSGIPEPVGLVLKRLSQAKVTDDGIQIVNVLPRRIDPCTWSTIRAYMDEPIGNREPEESEIPNDFELSILDETLTPDQKDVLRIERLKKEQEDGLVGLMNSADYDDDTVMEARRLMNDGMAPMMISRELGVPISEVMGMLST